MDKWYMRHEQGAGHLRILFVWYIYKIFGIKIAKFLIAPIAFFIGVFAVRARHASRKYKSVLNEYQIKHNLPISKFSTFTHINNFACSLMDKISASCDKKTRIEVIPEQTNDWDKLCNLIENNHGAFLICSHLGNIEAMAALAQKSNIVMHAFMQVGQAKIFHKFMTEKSSCQNVIIHPTETFDMSIGTACYDYIRSGHLVRMAGDRISAGTPEKTIQIPFLDVDCNFPMGVFTFAKLMDCPVFAIYMVNVGGEKYRLFVREIATQKSVQMLTQFTEFLEQGVLNYPSQWYNFYNFFNK